MDIRTFTIHDEGYQDALWVRKQVFVIEQKISESEEIDSLEDQSLHFVLYIDNEPAGASRLRTLEEGAKIERVCILPELRKKGLGEALMKEMENKARHQKLSFLLLNAQTQAEDFYQKIGYQTISEEPFLDANIPHVAMKKVLD